MREEVEQLRKSVEAYSKSSVGSVLCKVLDYATRPITEFNTYEAIEMCETLQNTARDHSHDQREYYRLAYYTARSKIDLPNEHFRSLLLQLLGDKDHQRVFEAVAKVEKSWSKLSSIRGSFQPYRRPASYAGRSAQAGALRCYVCNRIGHIVAKCLSRRGRVISAASSTSPDTAPK